MTYIMAKIICSVFFSLMMVASSISLATNKTILEKYIPETNIQILTFFTTLFGFYLCMNTAKTIFLIQERNINTLTIDEALPKYEEQLPNYEPIEMVSMLPEYTIIEI